MKTCLNITFDGRNYHGWQVQKNVPTVQGALQDAFEKLTGKRLNVTGCSRTDAGVGANSYICHLDGKLTLPEEKVFAALNSILPRDIAVKEVFTRPDDFHSRYSCIGKEYIYRIWNAKYRNPHLDGKALFYPKELDLEKISYVGEQLFGKHDFRAFMASGSSITDDTVRNIKYCYLTRQGDLCELRVRANGFLYNMVRIIVGTYLAANEDKLKMSVTDILASGNRANAGPTAEACGLYLNEVFYD